MSTTTDRFRRFPKNTWRLALLKERYLRLRFEDEYDYYFPEGGKEVRASIHQIDTVQKDRIEGIKDRQDDQSSSNAPSLLSFESMSFDSVMTSPISLSPDMFEFESQHCEEEIRGKVQQ
jgi:hypothetical protein